MGFLDRALSVIAGVPVDAPEGVRADEVKAIEPGDPAFYNMLMGFNRGSKAGANVTVDTALQVAAVLACCRVIAEGLAQVPCKLLQIDPATGVRRVAREHPLFRLLHRKPNDFQTSFEFREQLGFHTALCGNAYVVIIRDSRGRPAELLPFAPNYVSVQRFSNWRMEYRFTAPEGGGQFVLGPRDVWHLRGASWSGGIGMDTLALARNAVGLAIGAEEYGSELFANGARPQGILTTDNEVGPEKLAAIRDAWQEANAGSGQRFKTVAMTNGLKWQPISTTAAESQFIELRRFMIEEIARMFRVNPVMIMQQTNNMAYASVEQLFLAHVTHTLGPWFERFEQSAECALLSDAELDEGYQVELVPHGLTRGTAKDTADTLAVLRQNGAITGNEMREGMDLARADDEALETFEPAAHLFGNRAAPAPATVEE